MFLSMLVAWMIPDVPRSLREQLKKENMMLMEFLLNQDQEAQAKAHSQKRPNPCFPANIDIIVEAPVMEQEEEAPEEVEVILNELGSSRDSDPEVGGPDHETVGNVEEEQGGKEGDDTEAAEVEEKGDEAEELHEDVKGNAVDENADEKEESVEIQELNPTEEFKIDLDSFLSDLGLLGERRTFDIQYCSTFCLSSLNCDDFFYLLFHRGGVLTGCSSRYWASPLALQTGPAEGPEASVTFIVSESEELHDKYYTLRH